MLNFERVFRVKRRVSLRGPRVPAFRAPLVVCGSCQFFEPLVVRERLYHNVWHAKCVAKNMHHIWSLSYDVRGLL